MSLILISRYNEVVVAFGFSFFLFPFGCSSFVTDESGEKGVRQLREEYGSKLRKQ